MLDTLFLKTIVETKPQSEHAAPATSLQAEIGISTSKALSFYAYCVIFLSLDVRLFSERKL